MEKGSPRETAVKASFVASLIICVIVFVIASVKKLDLGIDFYALLTLAAFIICFAVYYYAIEFFIYRKLKLIYRTINRLKVDKKKGKKVDMKSDVLSEVNQEVVTWAQSKSKEINRLKETEIYRKEFIGNLSHELKTPIFSIQGYILTLLEGAMDDPEVAERFLKKASLSVERMTTLVADLDALIKLETSGPNLKIGKFNIVQSIQDIYEALDYAAKKKNISLIIKNKPEDPIWVLADKAKIEQVLTNLVANSINYGNEGGKTIVDIHDMDTKIMVEMSDNGIGINEQFLPRIFERFYRVDKSRTRHEGGSGLGLAIVKHIIEAHKQRINVNSIEGEGTTFNFTLDKTKK